MCHQRLRTLSDIKRDQVIPKGVKGYGGDERFKPTGKRMRSIQEVLCFLPQEEYERWKSQANDIAWFIPNERLWGQVDRLPNKKIIYLSPLLEFVKSDAAIIGFVVHEMAHVLLDHIGAGISNEEKEREVDRTIRVWGFAEEAAIADKELWNFFSAQS